MKKILIIVLLTLTSVLLVGCKQNTSPIITPSYRDLVKGDLEKINYKDSLTKDLLISLNGSIAVPMEGFGNIEIVFAAQGYLNVANFESAHLWLTVQLIIMIPGAPINFNFEIVYQHKNLHFYIPMELGFDIKGITIKYPITRAQFNGIREQVDVISSFLSNPGIIDILLDDFSIGNNGLNNTFATRFNTLRLAQILEGNELGGGLLSGSFTDLLNTEIDTVGMLQSLLLDLNSFKTNPEIKRFFDVLITGMTGITWNDITDKIVGIESILEMIIPILGSPTMGKLYVGSFLGNFNATANINYLNAGLKSITVDYEARAFESEKVKDALPILTKIHLSIEVDVETPTIPDFSNIDGWLVFPPEL